jgi:aryl-alcohol dehydrogenase-like predicted oxidoreductase
MRYKLLGNSGLRVSELCLGTMTFGRQLYRYSEHLQQRLE